MPAIGSFKERDLIKISFQEFLSYSRYDKKAYFERMESMYGYTPEMFAKELQTNIGSVRIWMSRVNHDPSNTITGKQKMNRKRLLEERIFNLIGPSMPARKLACVYE